MFQFKFIMRSPFCPLISLILQLNAITLTPSGGHFFLDRK